MRLTTYAAQLKKISYASISMLTLDIYNQSQDMHIFIVD